MRKAHSRRAIRLEEMIMHELGRILVENIQDPRLELVTISGLRLNTDLTVAEVLYTHSRDSSDQDQVEQGLDAARGYMRSMLGKRIKLRHVPELRFVWDSFLEETIHGPPLSDT
ncbi:MAG: 30S ribosome-binding factor RbfA [Desulfovermiculus sp.]|nr:30S ribosome-binding factor RbfA [Desulfovermiculus sp.]